MGEWVAVSAMKATMAFFFCPCRSPCDVLACPVLAKLGACACRWQSLALAEPGAPYWPTPLNDCEPNQMAALSGSL